jgi:cation diffusion facilitator CzcD-associated flavoprotein CzcO
VADAIVCGAGAAGLAAAAMLGRCGVAATVLERSDCVGASWRGRYDGLRLNTAGWMSTMPGYRATRRRYGEYPSRDSWIQYLEDYARHHAITVRFGTVARSVLRSGDGWVVDVGDEMLPANYVVVATGYDHDPFVPDWPGRDSFVGELIHSSAYRSPTVYRERDVLVVGPGTTGSEVASHIANAGAQRVRMACRTAPNITARKFMGLSVNIPAVLFDHLPSAFGDQAGWMIQRIIAGKLDRYGLGRAPYGVATALRKRHTTPAYDDGFIDDLKAGRIEVVPAVVGFDRADVMLADGRRIQPDAVIAATGYRRGLDSLVGHLGVLDDDGIPLVHGGSQYPSAPGLFFNGYRALLSGQLRLMRYDARAIAAAVRRKTPNGLSANRL